MKWNVLVEVIMDVAVSLSVVKAWVRLFERH